MRKGNGAWFLTAILGDDTDSRLNHNRTFKLLNIEGA
jgi:hypothetical protein